MRNVFTKLLYETEKGHDAVVVTIVQHSGSTPRGKGSMMLVGADGYLSGTIGGGAVEDQATKQAIQCIAEKKSETVLYNLADQGENTIGMVCGGDVIVNFQYVDAGDAEYTSRVQAVLADMERGLTGTFVIETENYGTFELPYEPEDRALIFGGGHIALALVPILRSVGFKVTVMENRAGFAEAGRFPDAHVVLGDYTRVSDYISLEEDDYLVIMTNGHSHDFEIQEQVLRYETAYVGVVGSRRKIASVNARLKEAGLTDEMISKVHTPIGLSIKAVTPAEIAVSIAGEMIYERALRREKKGIEQGIGCPMK